MPTDDVQIAMVRSGGSRGGSSSTATITRNDSIGNDGSSLNSGGGGGGGGGDGGSSSNNNQPSCSINGKGKQGSCRDFISKASKAKLGGGKGGSLIPVALYRARNARYTLVYSHGNATDIGAMHDRCAGIAKAVGVNVLAYDYTGYGLARSVEKHIFCCFWCWCWCCWCLVWVLSVLLLVVLMVVLMS